ncbi:MAG TPA: hypothetical protein DC054_08305 [Blastocatellia bacterium]|nr:hypothetical protein [Blastocatellia bacterium]
MGFISNTARKIVFWNYSRTSWQWDVLCVLILAFIFLTPKSWFASSPPVLTTLTTVVLTSDLIGNQSDTAEIDRRARAQLRRPSGQVIDHRPKQDQSGKVIAYEVDIR